MSSPASLAGYGAFWALKWAIAGATDPTFHGSSSSAATGSRAGDRATTAISPSPRRSPWWRRLDAWWKGRTGGGDRAGRVRRRPCRAGRSAPPRLDRSAIAGYARAAGDRAMAGRDGPCRLHLPPRAAGVGLGAAGLIVTRRVGTIPAAGRRRSRPRCSRVRGSRRCARRAGRAALDRAGRLAEADRRRGDLRRHAGWATP